MQCKNRYIFITIYSTIHRRREIMLQNLFAMENMNSSWSLCFGQQTNKNCDLRNPLACVQCYRSSPFDYNDVSTTAYSHKRHGLSVCSRPDFPERSCAFHRCKRQLAVELTELLDQLPSACQSKLAALTPSSNQTTRSEPATRSNSIDCEKDLPKLPIVNNTNHDVESSRLSDLIAPNGEWKVCKLYRTHSSHVRMRTKYKR